VYKALVLKKNVCECVHYIYLYIVQRLTNKSQGYFMRKIILLGVVFIFILSCAKAVEAPNSSSNANVSSGTSSSVSSSGGSTSSADTSVSDTTQDTLSTVSAQAPAGPGDLAVSIIAAEQTLVLTWSDVTAFKKNEYDGYQIWRNTSYSGWTKVGKVLPEKGFFKDESLDEPDSDYRGGEELKYQYRIVAYKERGDSSNFADDSLITQWSNLAGVQAVTELGFNGVGFEQPGEITMIRWRPASYSIHWEHSGLAPELGFVIQRVAEDRDSIQVVVDKIPGADGIDSITRNQYFTRSDWMDLDTLGATDNHFWVYGVGPASEVYRVYAFYSYEFGNVISEYTNEVVPPIEYADGIEFDEGPTDVKGVINANNQVSFTWQNNHNTGTYMLLNFGGAIPDVQIGGLSNRYTTEPLDRDVACALQLSLTVRWDDSLQLKDTTIYLGSDLTKSSKVSDKPECKEEAESTPTTSEGLANAVTLSIRNVESSKVTLEWSTINTTKNYLGFVVERTAFDAAGYSQVGITTDKYQTYYADNSINTDSISIYGYRVWAYDTLNGANVRVSIPSNVVSANDPAVQDTTPTQAFQKDVPTNLTVTRVYPAVYELRWNQSFNAVENGFVIQRLNLITQTTDITEDATSTTIDVQVGSWENIDTVGPDQNYFRAVEKGTITGAEFSDKYRYRVFAYYGSDARSEYSNEVTTVEAFQDNIQFEAPELSFVIDAVNDNCGLSWENTFANLGSQTQELVIEIQYSVNWGAWQSYGANPEYNDVQVNHQTSLGLGVYSTQAATAAYRIRYVWVDIYGGKAYSPWSKPAGIRPDLASTVKQ
jgi:hypothetical protein